jgi:hypothetical protein
LRLNTKGHNGDLRKIVRVTTNIPGSTVPIQLNIHGQLWEPVAYDPRIVAFGRINASNAASQPALENLEKKVTITNNLEQPANLTDVHCTNPAYHVDTKVLEPGKKFELTVTIVEPLKPGPNVGTIQVTTGIADTPTLNIPVQATRTADVEVSPPELLLSRTIGPEMRPQFTIRNHTQTPLDITDLEVSNPALQVELEEGRDATSYILHLTVPAGTELTQGGEKITFKTGLASQPEVTIPIVVRATPASRPTRTLLPRSKGH